ncbi:hypothetical protein BDN70DRAFT_896010 [Pholiota conissans]|uniref:Uncharacterized protein n=1 Tax=Pholiota conissans TaxID=109636 RepID=A0A9P5YYG7_9AGAR|nr:hypothetical protein BDN70DRAFT_896010 [Pholiota conissans]
MSIIGKFRKDQQVYLIEDLIYTGTGKVIPEGTVGVVVHVQKTSSNKPLNYDMGQNSLLAYEILHALVSKVYPAGIRLDIVLETEYYGFALRGIPQPERPFKVFPLDVLCLGISLENRTMHVESIIPKLGPFLDGMVHPDENRQYTAREALTALKKIYADLTPERMSQRLTSWLWTKERGIYYMNPDNL